MKHVGFVSKKTPVLATSPLQIKLNGTIDIIDRLLLAQRQAQWKVPNGGGDGGGNNSGGNSDSGNND